MKGLVRQSVKVEILGGKIVDKVPSYKDNNLPMGRIEDWAEDASKIQADREGLQQQQQQQQQEKQSDHESKVHNSGRSTGYK